MERLGFSGSIQDNGSKVKSLVGLRRGMEGREPSLGRVLWSHPRGRRHGVWRERAQTLLPSRSEPNADSSASVCIVLSPLPPGSFWKRQPPCSLLCRLETIRPNSLHRMRGISSLTRGFQGYGWGKRLAFSLPLWKHRKFSMRSPGGALVQPWLPKWE